MVAITVILAAVIGTFVLGLGGSTDNSASAGVTFSEESVSGGVDVTVTLNSLGDNTKNVTFKGDCSNLNSASALTGIGDSRTKECSSGDQINVVATTNSGDSNVVQTYTV